MRRFIRKVGRENIADLFDLRIADWFGNGTNYGFPAYLRALERRINEAIAREEAFTEKDLAVNGHDVMTELGIEAGPVEPIPLTEQAALRAKLYPYRGDTPREAEDPRRWMDDYDKILVERTVMGAPDLADTVLRLPMVYGSRDGQHRLFEYLKRMDDGRYNKVANIIGSTMQYHPHGDAVPGYAA